MILHDGGGNVPRMLDLTSAGYTQKYSDYMELPDGSVVEIPIVTTGIEAGRTLIGDMEHIEIDSTRNYDLVLSVGVIDKITEAGVLCISGGSGAQVSITDSAAAWSNTGTSTHDGVLYDVWYQATLNVTLYHQASLDAITFG
ncbi:MAG: hypothetical protein GY947_20420 [Rhodobacteraceae bacterium]|nr:hypothetical protein [Paracoccaceae bacterium]